MGSPKTGPTWRDVSRSVKTQKAKNKLIPKKFEKVTLTNQKTRSFWRHLRQYLNNIVLPPLKKSSQKKSVNYFNQYNCIQKNQPHHLQFEKENINHLKQHQKNTHHKTKRRKSKYLTTKVGISQFRACDLRLLLCRIKFAIDTKNLKQQNQKRNKPFSPPPPKKKKKKKKKKS